MILKYGVKHQMQLDEIKNKIKQTNIIKYGTENPLQNKEIRQKAKQTLFEKYGTTNIMLLDEIKNKIKKTNLKRYGVEVSTKNKEVTEKRYRTMIKKYGVKNPMELKKFKEKVKMTCMKKYGVPNAIMNIEIKEKKNNTMIKKYGTVHPLQAKEIVNKVIKTTSEFKKEVHDLFNGEYEVIGKYIKSNIEIQVIHKKCGSILTATPTRILDKHAKWRCHFCYPKCISNGTKAINDFLKNNNLNYQTEKTFDGCKDEKKLKFDFFLGKVIIEYDGEQHFRSVDIWGGEEYLKQTQRHDRIKNQYCIDNNIPLIRIPYWEYDNIEYILKNVLMHFNLIKKDDTYDESVVKKYLVDENWDHDKYIEMSKNY